MKKIEFEFFSGIKKIEHVQNMVSRETAEMKEYKRKMKEFSGNRAFRARFRDIVRTLDEEI